MGQLRAPIVDAIDKRNYHNDMKKSVVKRACVNYVSGPVAGTNMGQGTTGKEKETDSSTSSIPKDEVINRTAEIMERLEQEAKADEIAKTQEWTQKLLAEKPKEEINHLYNAATQSYSGTYGQGPVDETSKTLAEHILHEKEDQRNTIIQENL